MMSGTGIYVKENGLSVEKKVSIEEAITVYKDDPLSIYPKNFFRNMVKLRGWQNLVGKQISEKWDIKSAIDFGCASGYYLEGMKNVKIKGYEFAYDSISTFIPPEIKQNILYGDVQTNLIDGEFDLSMSIEVAEHILTENSETFVKNLTESSNKFIIFSSAKPGEGGTGHINLQYPEFWLNLFKENNFIESNDDTKILREIFRHSKGRKYSRFLSKKVLFLKKDF